MTQGLNNDNSNNNSKYSAPLYCSLPSRFFDFSISLCMQCHLKSKCICLASADASLTGNGKDVDIKIIIIENPSAYKEMLSLVEKSLSKDDPVDRAASSKVSGSDKTQHLAKSKRRTWPFLLPKKSKHAKGDRGDEKEEEEVGKDKEKDQGGEEESGLNTEAERKEEKEEAEKENNKGDRDSKSESGFQHASEM